MRNRDTFKYELKRGREVVYVGITNNPDRRLDEHSKSKEFTHMNIVGNRTTRDGAQRWEQDRIKTYQKSHGGKGPRFNK